MAKSTRSGYSNIRANPIKVADDTELVTDGPVETETDVTTEDFIGMDDALEDLLTLKVTELKDIADAEGVDVGSKATKTDLIVAIEAGRA